MGHRPDNPAGDALGQALGRQQTIVQHMRALPHGAVADALATVRASQASVTTKDAFEFLVLTAARSGEMRLATWDEMDLDAGVWTIPGARMKAKRDHRVPLSGGAHCGCRSRWWHGENRDRTQHSRRLRRNGDIDLFSRSHGGGPDPVSLRCARREDRCHGEG